MPDDDWLGRHYKKGAFVIRRKLGVPVLWGNMKYKIEKLDGSSVDPDAYYLVLRLDKPENWRERDAARLFYRAIKAGRAHDLYMGSLSFEDELSEKIEQYSSKREKYPETK